MQEPLTQSLRPRGAPKRKGGCLPKVLFSLFILGLFVACGYVAMGPYRTLSGLRIALAQGDGNALTEYVDFPTLRQNLKQQLMTRANAGVNSLLPNGIVSQIAGGIANTVVDTTVDTLVTPSGLNRIVSGASIVAGQLSSTSTTSPTDALANAHGSFQSTSAFTFTVPQSWGDLVIELTRHGLDWQLTNVNLSP